MSVVLANQPGDFTIDIADSNATVEDLIAEYEEVQKTFLKKYTEVQLPIFNKIREFFEPNNSEEYLKIMIKFYNFFTVDFDTVRNLLYVCFQTSTQTSYRALIKAHSEYRKNVFARLEISQQEIICLFTPQYKTMFFNEDAATEEHECMDQKPLLLYVLIIALEDFYNSMSRSLQVVAIETDTKMMNNEKKKARVYAMMEKIEDNFRDIQFIFGQCEILKKFYDAEKKFMYEKFQEVDVASVPLIHRQYFISLVTMELVGTGFNIVSHYVLNKYMAVKEDEQTPYVVALCQLVITALLNMSNFNVQRLSVLQDMQDVLKIQDVIVDVLPTGNLSLGAKQSLFVIVYAAVVAFFVHNPQLLGLRLLNGPVHALDVARHLNGIKSFTQLIDPHSQSTYIKISQIAGNITKYYKASEKIFQPMSYYLNLHFISRFKEKALLKMLKTLKLQQNIGYYELETYAKKSEQIIKFGLEFHKKWHTSLSLFYLSLLSLKKFYGYYIHYDQRQIRYKNASSFSDYNFCGLYAEDKKGFRETRARFDFIEFDHINFLNVLQNNDADMPLFYDEPENIRKLMIEQKKNEHTGKHHSSLRYRNR